MMLNKRGYQTENPGGSSRIPMAKPIKNLTSSGVDDSTPSPSATADFSEAFERPDLIPAEEIYVNFCTLSSGCYRITFTPTYEFNTIYRGTMRVDYAPDGLTISGDLYRFFKYPWRIALKELFPLRDRFTFPDYVFEPIRPLHIPIYPRDTYYSYLDVTGIDKSPLISSGPCELKLTVDEYEYTQPAVGSFDGTFPSTASRTFTVALSRKSPPPGYSSSYFEGNLYAAGMNQGTFTMGRVSSFFRRATLEIDTVTGAVAPTAVPASSGGGTEDFRSIFATAGWSLNTIYNDTSLPVPDGVDPDECCLSASVCTDTDGWTRADLHELMLDVRSPTTDLDKEWRFHLLVVPAAMGCARGIMYDQIEVPREGAVSFSDDGYPTSATIDFGTAEGQQQRDVPRAFLRSAAHEVGHGFNQQHQSLTGFGEPGADNSIMTTTPNVATVLGGPTTGAPGVFPDDIALSFNDHTRYHMIHFPDPVVRPGGMSWQAGHATTVPQADYDRLYVDAAQLELKVEVNKTRVKLGEVLPIRWELENRTRVAIPVPSNIHLEAHHAHILVTDPNGGTKHMPSFVLMADEVSIVELEPGKKLEAETNLFWSSKGFAFETPGRHLVEVRVLWNHAGIAFGVKGRQEVWVDYPVNDEDNAVASLLLNDEVGKFVALGGAPHLKEAVSNVEAVTSRYSNHVASKQIAGFKRRRSKDLKKGRKKQKAE